MIPFHIYDTNDEEARIQTWIGDGEHADAEVFTASGSQLDVVAVVVMDTGFGQHSVVLNLTFTEKGGKANGIAETKLNCLL